MNKIWSKNIASIILVMFLVMTAFFSIGVHQARADSYKTSDNSECRVGFPEVVSLDPTSVQSGTFAISHDIVTDSQLMATLRKGKLEGFSIKSSAGKTLDFTPVEDLALEDINSFSRCVVPFCLTFQPPRCFTIPSGLCVCSCGPFIASPS